jgi:hypothetical protein
MMEPNERDGTDHPFIPTSMDIHRDNPTGMFSSRSDDDGPHDDGPHNNNRIRRPHI